MTQRIFWITLFVFGVAASAQTQLGLPQLEQMALARNPTVGQAAQAVRAARGQARQAGLWPNPSVGYEGAEIRGGSFRGGEQGFFVQQQILLGGKLKAGQKAAQAGVFEQQATSDAQRQAVLTAVRLGYYKTLAAQQEVELRQQLVKISNNAVTTTQQLGNVGQADQPDQLQAQVEAEQAALDLEQAQQRLAASWVQLASLVGDPGLAQQKLAGDLSAALPQIDGQAYLQRLLAESPSVRVAQAAITRAELELRSQRKQPIPDLTVRAGAEDNRELIETSQRPAGWQSFAEVGVNIPIFNRNQGDIQTAAADLESAHLDLTRTQLELRQRAAPELATYLAARLAVGRYQAAMLPQAKRAYDMLLENYQAMAASYPQVLVAQRTWFQLQVGYLEQLQRLWTSATTLQGFLLDQGLQAPGSVLTPTMGVRP